MRAIIGIVVTWAALGVFTYGSCIGRYDNKFGRPIWERYAPAEVRGTCRMQAAFPFTGLPLVLGTDGWHWQWGWA